MVCDNEDFFSLKVGTLAQGLVLVWGSISVLVWTVERILAKICSFYIGISMDMIQQDHIGMIHSDHIGIGIGMVVSVEP